MLLTKIPVFVGVMLRIGTGRMSVVICVGDDTGTVCGNLCWE